MKGCRDLEDLSCLTSAHRSGALQSAPEQWVYLLLWRSECRTHPPLGGSPTAHGRWEPLHGGQELISLEYQTYTSAYLSDTLVTGLPPPTRQQEKCRSAQSPALHLVILIPANKSPPHQSDPSASFSPMGIESMA